MTVWYAGLPAILYPIFVYSNSVHVSSNQVLITRIVNCLPAYHTVTHIE